MPVDLAFELSYLLSDAAGAGVEVTGYSYDAESGVLCVEARVEGLGERRACVELRGCRGLEGARLARCLSKTLARREDLVARLAGLLTGRPS